MSMRVSVVMAVRDGERYLVEAIDSILDQTRRPDEVIVVNDGSTDATADILAGYGDVLSVIVQDPLGVSAALNRGITAATGDVIGFLDADDVFLPNGLAARLGVLERDDELDIVVGSIEQFVSPELADEVAGRFRVDATPVMVPLFQAVLVRRRVFDVVGMLDESFSTGSNIDWVARARVAGVRVAELEQVVTRRRIHLWNTGVTKPLQTRANLLSVLRAHSRRTSPPTSTPTPEPM